MRIEAFRPDGEVRRYFGVYPAIVTSIVRDSDNLGRIEVKFPWLGSDGADVRALATLCTPYADDDQGFEMIPAVDTQVVVAFEAGDLRRPYVIGACWNGSESLPEQPAQPNDKRLIRTRAGCLIKMNLAGQVSITANATVEVTASAVNVHAATAIFDGLIQCQTLITNSVVSSSYTPGAGNVW